MRSRWLSRVGMVLVGVCLFGCTGVPSLGCFLSCFDSDSDFFSCLSSCSSSSSPLSPSFQPVSGGEGGQILPGENAPVGKKVLVP
jgi:hypothetical protein